MLSPDVSGSDFIYGIAVRKLQANIPLHIFP